MIKKVYMRRTGMMTKISFCLIFTAILAVPCKLSAESLDKLPPIPDAQTALIYSASHKYTKAEFIKTLVGSVVLDKDSVLGIQKLSIALLRRGGAVGRQMAEDTRTKECTTKKMRAGIMSEELQNYCATVVRTHYVLLSRDHNRALFSSLSFSFDKSLTIFANDCYTYGSCEKAWLRIIDISKNGQAVAAPLLYIELCGLACKKEGSFNGCGADSPDGKKPYSLSFLSKDVVEACQVILQQTPD